MCIKNVTLTATFKYCKSSNGLCVHLGYGK